MPKRVHAIRHRSRSQSTVAQGTGVASKSDVTKDVSKKTSAPDEKVRTLGLLVAGVGKEANSSTRKVLSTAKGKTAQPRRISLQRRPNFNRRLKQAVKQGVTSKGASTPSKGTSKPSKEASKSSKEASKSSKGASTPSQRPSTPSKGTSKPSKEASKSSKEASKPSKEASKSSKGVRKVLDRASKPSASAGDSKKPVALLKINKFKGGPTGSASRVPSSANASESLLPPIAQGRSLKDALQLHPKVVKEGKQRDEVHTVHAAALDLQSVPMKKPPVPSLSYGLERVLFNPGVYHLQDPRSRVYNFDPYLQTIMPVAEFDFNALKRYVTSSKDEPLQQIAQEHGKKYVGSTSSMTGVLAHFHFLLSQWRTINTNTLSQGFPDKLRTFTRFQRCPSAIFLRKRDKCYAIDADKEFDSANILSMLGKSMEKFLTLSTQDYERYRNSNSDSVTEDERNAPEAFHYSTMGDFLMRSQLDAYDARLPGTGMFDLKTRAVVSIRMNTQDYENGKGYEIRSRHGEWESFEREYFDMIRSAFLKYSLQVRMGRMDGIFVAFHNTERIFGFQYVSLPEMDSTLHGQWETSLGDQEFKMSLNLLNKCLDRASKKFPDKSLRIHVETRDTRTPFMYVFVEPVTEEQIQQIQTTNQEKIAEFERNVLGLNDRDSTNDTSAADKAAAKEEWAELQAEVAQEMDNDEMSPQRDKAALVIDAGTIDGSLGDSRPTQENFEHGGVVETDAAADGEEISKLRLNSVADTHQNNHEHSNADPILHDFKPENVGAAPGGTEERKEQHENGPESAQTSHVPTRIPEIDGEKEVAEMRETLSRVRDDPSKVKMEIQDSGQGEDSEMPADAVFLDNIEEEQASIIPEGSDGSLLAMTVTIRNKVNDKYVLRPSDLGADDKWSVEYSIAEVPTASRAWSLYGACMARRKEKMDSADVDEDDVAANYYLRKMRELSEKGKEWRKSQNQMDHGSERVVLGQSSPNDTIKRSTMADSHTE
ncbi:MAG: hypothetical protein M1812_003782 [Candelaria pacifica]|nr:MAG: hypothetical protein M1812_003782 [Candelaria pacifica]